MQRTLTLLVAILAVCTLSAVSHASLVDLTAGGQGISKTNVGFSYVPVPGSNLTLTAVSKIGQSGLPDGTVGTIYIGDKGTGVQNIVGEGSKEISGGGPNGDELLRFTYTTPVVANAIDLYLAKVKVEHDFFKDDVMQITMFFEDSSILIFDNAAIYSAFTVISGGDDKGIVDFGSLSGLGGHGGLESFDLLVIEGHALVSGVSTPNLVPEPMTIALMALGLPLFAKRRRRM